jgi:hypothetical protein
MLTGTKEHKREVSSDYTKPFSELKGFFMGILKAKTFPKRLIFLSFWCKNKLKNITEQKIQIKG